MAARKFVACFSLIAFAITSQPALAANGDDPPQANPSASPSPAKRQHRHHRGKHRRQQQQQQQQQAPQPTGAPNSN
jgi:hypothetical protein